MTRALRCIGVAVALAVAWCAGEAGAADHRLVTEALYPEGPVLVDGALWYAEMTADRVTRIAGDDRTVVQMPRDCGPTSIAPYGATRLLVLCHRSGGLKVLSRDGRLVGEVDEDETGARLTLPNDSFEDRRGGVYFSSSGPFDPRSQPSGRIFHLRADGTAHLVAENIVYANGVFATADGILLVSEHLGHRILRFHIMEDGTLEPMEAFADNAALGLPEPPERPFVGPDGLEVASDGRVFVAIYGAGKVLVLSPDGNLVGEIPVPMPFLTNIVLDEAHGRAFLTGAYSNTIWPYAGSVIEIDLP